MKPVQKRKPLGDPLGPDPHVRILLTAEVATTRTHVSLGCIAANKDALSSVSADYFSRMFTNGMKETSAAEISIVLPDALCAAQFYRMLQVAVMGLQAWQGYNPTLADMSTMMKLADQFLVPTATERCNDHILAHLTADGVQIAAYCRKVAQCPYMQSARVVQELHANVAGWFRDLDGLAGNLFQQGATSATWWSFPRLPMEFVTHLLQRDDLEVLSENTVFSLALLWAEVNNRTESAQPIFAACRYEHMDAAFLSTVVATHLRGPALSDALRTSAAGRMFVAATPFEVQAHALAIRPNRNIHSSPQIVYVNFPVTVAPDGRVIITGETVTPHFFAKGHAMQFSDVIQQNQRLLTVCLRYGMRPQTPDALITVRAIALIHTRTGWCPTACSSAHGVLGTSRRGASPVHTGFLREDDPALAGPHAQAQVVDGKIELCVKIE